MNLRSIVEALADYTVVLQPDRDVPEWWAGAPSVAVSPDGVFYLAARMREGDSPRGKRGYEIRILRSTDGLHFTPIHHIRREDVGVSGFERPALLWDHGTGAYRLYTCTGLQQGWVILRFDDSPDPGGFRPTTARTVLSASYPDDGFVHVTGYKDPIVFHDQRIWHMFVIAIDRVERIRHEIRRGKPCGAGRKEKSRTDENRNLRGPGESAAPDRHGGSLHGQAAHAAGCAEDIGVVHGLRMNRRDDETAARDGTDAIDDFAAALDGTAEEQEAVTAFFQPDRAQCAVF